MKLIRGKNIASDILDNIKLKIEKIETKPTLAVILVGEDKASEIYVGLKEKAAQQIGFGFKLYKYDSSVQEDVILEKIKEINEDGGIGGLIVQLPLPEKLDKHKIINAIDPQKDVDGFCEVNQELFFQNQDVLYPVFPKAIIKMVEFALKNRTPSVLSDVSPFEYKGGEGSAVCKFTNTKAVIVCQSDDFGKIMQKYFEKIKIEAQYVFCDDLDNEKDLMHKADIIVTACGKMNLISSQLVKNRTIIIDGGIIKEGGKIFGDVDFETFKETDCLVSPVPGGVGPVTVACLLENVYLAYCKNKN